jgi:hypothetical protein
MSEYPGINKSFIALVKKNFFKLCPIEKHSIVIEKKPFSITIKTKNNGTIRFDLPTPGW